MNNIESTPSSPVNRFSFQSDLYLEIILMCFTRRFFITKFDIAVASTKDELSPFNINDHETSTVHKHMRFSFVRTFTL